MTNATDIVEVILELGTLLYEVLLPVAEWVSQETGIFAGSPEYFLIWGAIMLAVLIRVS